MSSSTRSSTRSSMGSTSSSTSNISSSTSSPVRTPRARATPTTEHSFALRKTTRAFIYNTLARIRISSSYGPSRFLCPSTVPQRSLTILHMHPSLDLGSVATASLYLSLYAATSPCTSPPTPKYTSAAMGSEDDGHNLVTAITKSSQPRSTRRRRRSMYRVHRPAGRSGRSMHGPRP